MNYQEKQELVLVQFCHDLKQACMLYKEGMKELDGKPLSEEVHDVQDQH